MDAKIGVTQGLTADLTYNTDFAQVEADEQQVNLTRFSLFFPEKRDFFLENLGLFGFGGVAATGGGDVPILFHSRRIGFDAGRAVPIEAGGRLTGRVGPVQPRAAEHRVRSTTPVTGVPRTNFSVLRVKRDVLRRSSIGLIFTGRDHVPGARRGSAASNETYGARRHVCLLRQPRDQHLLGAHPHRRRVGRRRQLSRAARLRRRSLRRAARAPGRRRQLPARDRLRPPRRRPPLARSVPLQPAARAPAAWCASTRYTGTLVYIGDRRRSPRHPRLARRVRRRVPEQRQADGELRRHVRAPAAAAARSSVSPFPPAATTTPPPASASPSASSAPPRGR